MNDLEKEELLKSSYAKARMNLARYLTTLPTVSYCDAVRCLSVAPRNKEIDDYERGRMAGLRLMGKE
jgi:hypothetical protein